MKPQLLDSHPPITRERLAKLQRDLRVAIPADYAAFLLKTNGGKFHATVLTSGAFPVSYFYGVDADIRLFDIEAVREQLLTLGLVPSDTIPVASTTQSGDVCISASDQRVSIVDFGGGELTSQHVADSFSHFMDTLEIKTRTFISPLETAIETDDCAALAALLSSGTELPQRDEYGRTPLMRAARRSRLRIVQLLLNGGADIGARDDRNNTALFHAVFGGGVDCIEMLVRSGADLDSVNSDGATPLIEAIGREQIRCAMKLIALGADIELSGRAGVTAFSRCEVGTYAYEFVKPALVNNLNLKKIGRRKGGSHQI